MEAVFNAVRSGENLRLKSVDHEALAGSARVAGSWRRLIDEIQDTDTAHDTVVFGGDGVCYALDDKLISLFKFVIELIELAEGVSGVLSVKESNSRTGWKATHTPVGDHSHSASFKSDGSVSCMYSRAPETKIRVIEAYLMKIIAAVPQKLVLISLTFNGGLLVDLELDFDEDDCFCDGARTKV